jgi:hypothetical protein
MVDTTRDIAGARELILGFDAGCSTCSGIARRIEERVGDKLVIRNLRDPELIKWRREALGEAAPWAPTLFLVEGSKVRAWAGVKMGLALSHRLGPKDTWRVMQVLGELGATPHFEDPSVLRGLPLETREAAVGISRGQFLKGVGGAAVAMSVLSGGALSPSVASATATSGTTEQQTLAKSIVNNSRQFQALKAQQAQVGATFGLGSALLKVDGNLATVTVRSPSAVEKRTGITTTFVVDLRRKFVMRYRHTVYGRTSDSKRIVMTDYANGLAARPFHRAVFGDTYVVTDDNRIMSHEQYKALLADSAVVKDQAFPDGYIPSECEKNAEAFCSTWISNLACAGVSIAVGGALMPTGVLGLAAGAAAGVACGVYAAKSNGCSSMATSQCSSTPTSPPVVQQQSPSYYCYA